MVVKFSLDHCQHTALTYFYEDFTDSWKCCTETPYIYTLVFIQCLYSLLVDEDQYIERKHACVNGSAVVVSSIKEEAWSGTG